MSSDAKLTKKQKKALAFRERKGKSKASSSTVVDAEAEEDARAVPVMEDQDRAADGLGADAVVPPKEDPARDTGSEEVVAGKKRKRAGGESEGKDAGKGKGKKRRTAPVDTEGDGDAKEEGDGEAEEGGVSAKGKPQRFILFVGNLKYTTTKEAIEKHFAACDPPPSVRLMAPKPGPAGKQTAKSKGFAFLEFPNKKGLQAALKMHHTELQGRTINVELTAGGGGKSEKRIAKVKERNKELFEQRKKKLENTKGADKEGGLRSLVKSQRYSATSGFEQAPSTKRTWSVPDGNEEEPAKKKRGSKKRPRSQGTGVNAIPVG